MRKPSQEEQALAHRKPCTLCHTQRDVLIRCQIDSTGKWHFVCPGKCWKTVSGGVIDGDLAEGHEEYRYGGMWKNKHAGVSAKVPKRLKGKMVRGAKGEGKKGEGGQGEDGESDGSVGSGGSQGSAGSQGSVGSARSRGGGVAVEDETSEEGPTIVGSSSSINDHHANEKT